MYMLQLSTLAGGTTEDYVTPLIPALIALQVHMLPRPHSYKVHHHSQLKVCPKRSCLHTVGSEMQS